MSNLLIKSLNLGIIDSALNWLIGALTTLFQWLVNFTIDLVIKILADILYSIGLTLLSLVDFFQAFFNALCGLGTYYDNGVAMQGDPILALITNKAVLQVFLALTIVAVIMLILTTIIAMVRTEFTTEGAKNTKGNIIGSALKSLAMFFVVPAACVFGIILSSGLLKAVYNATSGGDGVTAGAMVWYASSYNANKCRIDSVGTAIVEEITFYEDNWINSSNSKWAADFNINQGSDSERREAVANAIDNAFKNETEIGSDGPRGIGSISYSFTDLMEGDLSAFDEDEKRVNYYSYRNVQLTKEYYELRGINYITMYLGGGIAIYIMFIAAFGLIIRLYKCAVLFMVSAPISALTPLDGGSAYKNWRKLMIGSVLSAFSVVVAFNLIFLLIPIVSNINIFKPSGFTAVWNRLVSLIFILTGLYSIKETSKWVASMLGIEDPLAAGSEIAGKVMGTVGKVGTLAATGGMAMGANVIKSGLALSSRVAAAAGKDGPGKVSKALSSAAGKVGKFEGKMAGMGQSVIGKTITKQMNRFDDFAGGANVFGGAEGEGLGGLLNKGATKLYGTSLKAGGFALGAGGGIVGAVATNIEGHNKKEEIKEKKEQLKTDKNRLKTLKSKNKEDLTSEEIKEMGDLDKRITENKSEVRKYNVWNRSLGSVLSAGASYSGGNDKMSKYWSKINDEAATFTKTQNQAKDFGESVEKNVGDALRAAAMYGGVNTEKGKEAAKGPIEELAKKLNTTFDKIVEKLQTKDGQEKLKKDGYASLKILNDYAGKVDVNVSGFDPSKLSSMDNLKPEGFNNAEEVIHNMLSAQGVSGSSLKEQIDKNMQEIKAEQKKVADEIKKETDKMLKQATLIAKQMKKLNPPKK